MTDVTAKNINLLGIRARAYNARARKHTLTSKHTSNCWTQCASHRNHPISASTHCISIDFSKKSAVSCPFLPLWGNIPLYTSRGCATKANFDRALVYTPYSLHAWHFMPLWETQRRCRKTSFAPPPHQFRSIGQIAGWLYMTLQRLLVFIIFSRKFVHFELSFYICNEPKPWTFLQTRVITSVFIPLIFLLAHEVSLYPFNFSSPWLW